MGFRFQKRIKVGGGARINVSKSGLGMSVGRPGFRAGVNSKGKFYSSVGIPGTGLTYRQYYGIKGGRRRKNIGIGTIIFVLLALTFGVGVFRAFAGLVEKNPWIAGGFLCGVLAIATARIFLRKSDEEEDPSLDYCEQHLGKRMFGDLASSDQGDTICGSPGPSPQFLIDPSAHQHGYWRLGLLIATIVIAVVGFMLIERFQAVEPKTLDPDASKLATTARPRPIPRGYRVYKAAIVYIKMSVSDSP